MWIFIPTRIFRKLLNYTVNCFISDKIYGGKMSQYLTFRLNNDLFAFDIGNVLEVLSYTRITRVPRMPEFLSGIINLRGHIVPVVNLCLRLNLPVSELTADTCIVIIEIEMQAEKVMVGILADAVSEVADIESENIFSPPEVGMRISSELLRGVGKKEGKFIMIPDTERILLSEDIQ